LLYDAGYTYDEIAKELYEDQNKVANYIRKYINGGLRIGDELLKGKRRRRINSNNSQYVLVGKKAYI